jgi:hypothetical protein
MTCKWQSTLSLDLGSENNIDTLSSWRVSILFFGGTEMAQPEMCITCKKFIPQKIWENKVSPFGNPVCLGCWEPCGLDTQGMVYHMPLHEGCTVELTWEEVYIQDSHHPMA